MDRLLDWLNLCNDRILWGIPMLLLHLGTSMWLTVRLHGLQLWAWRAIRNLLSNNDGKRNRSSLRALYISLAGTIGTGNIAGVAGAVSIGGPGAVFWMWIAALFGMATKYAEIVLSHLYRSKDASGVYHGGPMTAIQNGLGSAWRPLAVAFCIFGIGASLGIGNMVQVHTAASAVQSLLFQISVCRTHTMQAAAIGIGLAMAVSTFLLLNGNGKAVGRATEHLVPLMSAGYMLLSLYVIATYIAYIPQVFADIWRNAFSSKAIGGGCAGISIHSAMRQGISRGIFSNEAGLGSAAIAHASSERESAAEEGLFGVIEVAFVTLLIGTVTALILLLPEKAGVYTIPYGTQMGAMLTLRAMETCLSPTFVSAAAACILLCFALSTVFTWGFYGETCAAFLGGRRAAAVYRMAFCSVMIPASLLNAKPVWLLADAFNALMAIPNLLAVLLMTNVVVEETRRYREKGRICG